MNRCWVKLIIIITISIIITIITTIITTITITIITTVIITIIITTIITTVGAPFTYDPFTNSIQSSLSSLSLHILWSMVIHPHHQSNHHRHHRHHYCQVVFLLLQLAVSIECQNLLETFDLALVKQGLQVAVNNLDVDRFSTLSGLILRRYELLILLQEAHGEVHLKMFLETQNVSEGTTFFMKDKKFHEAQNVLEGKTCFRRHKMFQKAQMFQEAQDVSEGTKCFRRQKMFQEAKHVLGGTQCFRRHKIFRKKECFRRHKIFRKKTKQKCFRRQKKFQEAQKNSAGKNVLGGTPGGGKESCKMAAKSTNCFLSRSSRCQFIFIDYHIEILVLVRYL